MFLLKKAVGLKRIEGFQQGKANVVGQKQNAFAALLQVSLNLHLNARDAGFRASGTTPTRWSQVAYW